MGEILHRTQMHIYRPRQPRETREVMLAAEPEYMTLKELVCPLLDGGKLEHVSVLFDGQRADMFIDDDFAAKGLFPNEEATAIYHAYARSRGRSIGGAPIICGPAVVFPRRVWW